MRSLVFVAVVFLCLLSAVLAASATASHILVKTEGEANSIKKEIEEGADFSEMAKKHSSCPSGKRGGSLGSFGREPAAMHAQQWGWVCKANKHDCQQQRVHDESLRLYACASRCAWLDTVNSRTVHADVLWAQTPEVGRTCRTHFTQCTAAQRTVQHCARKRTTRLL